LPYKFCFSSTQQAHYFPLFREAPKLPLGKDKATVSTDLKHTVRSGNQLHFNIGSEFLFQLLLQTGGPWLVVSPAAVFDSDFHKFLRQSHD